MGLRGEVLAWDWEEGEKGSRSGCKESGESFGRQQEKMQQRAWPLVGWWDPGAASHSLSAFWLP